MMAALAVSMAGGGRSHGPTLPAGLRPDDRRCVIRPDFAKFTVFDDCGHGPHNEQPEQTMALLRDFILEWLRLKQHVLGV
jgi:pimeloyl-ACP methyl ester carboxylesterase